MDAAPAERTPRLDLPDVVLLALALASIVPALLVRYPESVDYLNHLARLYIIEQPPANDIHRFYEVHWHLVPDLAIDLVAGLLGGMLAPAAIMKGAWIASVLGLAAATWFLHRSLHRRTEPTLVLGATALINLPLTAGYLNFALAMPVALAAVGMWFRMGDRPSPRALAALNAVGGVIFVMHLAAAASLLLTLGAVHVLRAPMRPVAVVRRCLEIGAGFIVPVLLLGLAKLSGPWVAMDIAVYSWPEKFRLLLGPIYTGHLHLDATSAIAVVVALFVAMAAVHARLHPRLVPALAVWVVVLASPYLPGPAGAVDVRLAIFPFMLLIASLSAARPSRAAQTMILTMTSVIVVARIAYLVPEWRSYNRQVEAFRAAAAVVPGSRVLVARAPSDSDPTCQADLSFGDHLPSLLVIDRHAFVSTQLVDAAKRPVRLTQAVLALTSPEAPMMPWEVLALADTPQGKAKLAAADPNGTWDKAAIDWRRNYDYLALMRPPCTVDLPPDPGLVPVGASAIYRIYRIRHE